METAYYVTHPSLGKSAVVYAPSTEKARTTLLDYLERQGVISRKDRHSFRRNMVAERLDDPNVPANIVLHYGYEESRFTSLRTQIPSPEVLDIPVKLEQPEVIDIPVKLEEPDTDEILLDQISREVESPGPKLMPIQQVMLRGYSE